MKHIVSICLIGLSLFSSPVHARSLVGKIQHGIKEHMKTQRIQARGHHLIGIGTTLIGGAMVAHEVHEWTHDNKDDQDQNSDQSSASEESATPEENTESENSENHHTSSNTESPYKFRENGMRTGH